MPIFKYRLRARCPPSQPLTRPSDLAAAGQWPGSSSAKLSMAGLSGPTDIYYSSSVFLTASEAATELALPLRLHGGREAALDKFYKPLDKETA